MRTAPPDARGFTLLELMIAVAVVGILAAVAYPAYTESVRKSHRADARAALNEVAQFMARTYAQSKSYTPGGALPALPLSAVPREGARSYDITLDPGATAANAYRLLATPTGRQTQDRCGVLSVDHLGVRAAAGGEGCW